MIFTMFYLVTLCNLSLQLPMCFVNQTFFYPNIPIVVIVFVELGGLEMDIFHLSYFHMALIPICWSNRIDGETLTITKYDKITDN